MELELKRTRLDVFDIGAELVFTEEESADTIVPDYCPDIARIVDTEGIVLLHGRELREGRAEVSGTVRITVLYVPDGERGLRTLEFAIPFSTDSDAKTLSECSALQAQVNLEMLETRLLNPRKISTQCRLIIHLTAYRKMRLQLCTDVEAPPEAAVEKRLEQQHVSALTQITEKDFTFSDQWSVPGGREPAAEILYCRANPVVLESQQVGSKLICKGAIRISVLYRTTQGQCRAATGELPFSQILETEGAPEISAATVDVKLTGADFQLLNGEREGWQISVTLYLHAVALFRQEVTFSLLTDLYSTVSELTYDAEALTLPDLRETLQCRQAARESIETGVEADTLLLTTATCGPVTVSREGEVHTTVALRALYLDEDGAPLTAERSVEVSSHVTLPADCSVQATAVCSEELQGSLTGRGIEVRFTVAFLVQPILRCKCVGLNSIHLGEQKDLAGAPSLVLRALEGEETLWQLAKRHHTTIADILSANQLGAESEAPRGTLLLIPRHRE